MIEYKVVSWDESGIPLDRFNEAGLEGWEYVSMLPGSYGWTHYLFKRTGRFCCKDHMTPGEALDAELPFDLVVTDVSEETAAD